MFHPTILADHYAQIHHLTIGPAPNRHIACSEQRLYVEDFRILLEECQTKPSEEQLYSWAETFYRARNEAVSFPFRPEPGLRILQGRQSMPIRGINVTFEAEYADVTVTNLRPRLTALLEDHDRTQGDAPLSLIA